MVLAAFSAARSAPGLHWQEVPCPCCSSERATPVVEAPDPAPARDGLWFAVVRCDRCGLHYTNPRPDDDSISAFYAADYLPHRRPNSRRCIRNWYPLGALRGRASERRGLPWHGQGRLLDFGCGGGGFLARMADQGWKVAGVDISPKAVRTVRESLGLPAYEGTLPHPDLKPGTFEVVTMWHSLEHVHDPMAVLAEAYRLLVPGGRLLVAAPNIRSQPFRWFGQAWYGLDLPRHLTHFCPRTLRQMLECNGFRVDSLRRLKHADWLRSSAKLAVRLRRSGVARRLLRYKACSRLVAWLQYALGQSDCLLAIAERPVEIS